jgi:hypothetical protein
MTALSPASDPPVKRVRQRKTGVIRPVGPYSTKPVLGRIDARTREGRALAAYRAELVEHCGGSPTRAQQTLIEQIALIRLRVALMDDRFAEGEDLGDMAGRAYRAWVNTIARLMTKLGPPPAQPQEPPHVAFHRRLAEEKARKDAARAEGRV